VAVPSRTKILLFSLDVKSLPSKVFSRLNTPELYFRIGSQSIEKCVSSYQLPEEREYPKNSPYYRASKRLVQEDCLGFILPRNTIPSMGRNVKTSYEVFLVIVIDHVDYCLASFTTKSTRAGVRSRSVVTAPIPASVLQAAFDRVDTIELDADTETEMDLENE